MLKFSTTHYHRHSVNACCNANKKGRIRDLGLYIFFETLLTQSCIEPAQYTNNNCNDDKRDCCFPH